MLICANKGFPKLKKRFVTVRDDEQVKIELLSQWKLEAEFRNFSMKPSYITSTFIRQNLDKHCIKIIIQP